MRYIWSITQFEFCRELLQNCSRWDSVRGLSVQLFAAILIEDQFDTFAAEEVECILEDFREEGPRVRGGPMWFPPHERLIEMGLLGEVCIGGAVQVGLTRLGLEVLQAYHDQLSGQKKG